MWRPALSLSRCLVRQSGSVADWVRLRLMGRDGSGWPCRPSPSWRGRELECVAQARTHAPLQRRSIAGDTKVASAGDSTVVRREEIAGEREGIADAHAELEVQLAGERQVEQGGMRDSACDATSLHPDIGHGEVREQIIEPLDRGIDGK
jgi:hypothetical protein